MQDELAVDDNPDLLFLLSLFRIVLAIQNSNRPKATRRTTYIR
jgi:hypothetical protein